MTTVDTFAALSAHIGSRSRSGYPTNVSLGWYFTQKAENLPQKLTHLEFQTYFHELSNLPSTLKFLSIEFGFDFSIDELSLTNQKLKSLTLVRFSLFLAKHRIQEGVDPTKFLNL